MDGQQKVKKERDGKGQIEEKLEKFIQRAF